MRKNKLASYGILAIIATCILSKPARAQNQAIESTVELGATYYHMGKYDAALAEFNTVLASDPQNSLPKVTSPQYSIKKLPLKNLPPKNLCLQKTPK